MIPKPLARRVATSARQFQQWEPWREFTDEYVFAFELPGEPHPVYGVVLGSAGTQFGLSLCRGERALEQLRLITTDTRPPFVAPMLLLSFDPPAAVPAEFLELARTAGLNDRVLPVVIPFAAGGRSRPPSAGELRLVAQVVEAMLHANEAGLLRPRKFDPHRGGKVLTLAVEGEAGKVRGVTAHFATTTPPAANAQEPVPLPWPLPELPLLDAHHVVAFEPSPLGVENEVLRPWMLFVADAADGRLVGMQLVTLDEPDDLDEAVHTFAGVLANPSTGEPGLPRRLTFVHQRLAAALAPGLTARGVAVEVVDEHPCAREVSERLREHVLTESGDADAIPDAADEERWLVHHRRLLGRIKAELEHVDLHSRKALAAFFGDADVCDELDEPDALLHRVAYRDWYVTCYRGKAGRRTVAERLLEQPLPAAERCLLAARVAARTGLYRVTALRPPVVVLSDVFSDYEVEIHDGTLAATSAEGAALAVRIAEANGHRFVMALGPLVPPLRLDAALAELDARWGTFTSAELQRRPEILATLWQWSLDDAAAAHAPRLTNTDGDALRPLVATFSVTDWPRLQAALDDRADVETEGDGSWAWTRPDSEPDSDGATLLANLERVADELLVEVNSQQRLAAARAWLEAVPGVAFVSQRDTGGDEAAPHTSRSPRSEASPEELAQLQAHIDATTMRWLDERVPMLGQRTPREAVKTPEGRQLVLRLIRSWPDPGGIRGLRTPRERLRRELGLQEEGAADEGSVSNG